MFLIDADEERVISDNVEILCEVVDQGSSQVLPLIQWFTFSSQSLFSKRVSFSLDAAIVGLEAESDRVVNRH